MPLQAFSFPFPETRFIRAASVIYKFKIRAGSSYGGDETVGGNFSQDLEDIIRTVLGNLDSLQPFSTTHFNVFPYKKHWEGVSKVMCKHGEKKLTAYPFILILYLEKNTQKGKLPEEALSPVSPKVCCVSEPLSKRCRRDSPLEDATLKDVTEDIESVVGRNMDNPQAEREVKEDPGQVDMEETMEFINCKLKSGDSAVTGSESPGKVQSGTTQDEGGELDGVEDEDLAPGTSKQSGILTELASHIFPFSWFFRDP